MLQDQFAAERSRLVLLTLSARAYASRTLAKEGTRSAFGMLFFSGKL